MICKIQVVTIGEDGRKETREITSIQRTDVKPETLGLTLAEGKMILKDLQQVVVESQVSSLLVPKRTCPECGEPRCSKGKRGLDLFEIRAVDTNAVPLSSGYRATRFRWITSRSASA